MSEPIPAPPGLPIIGNAWDIDPQDSSLSFQHLAETYGRFYKLRLGGKDIYIVGNYEIYNEICDEKRFTKGLVVGCTSSEMPYMTDYSRMFNEMHEISTQLIMKWARHREANIINIPEDFTRLTLDSITLCAMETRFNSFYRQDMHPFPQAMVRVLAEAGARASRPTLVNTMMRAKKRQCFEDINFMRKTAMDIISDKMDHPSGKNTLLSAMLNGTDPKTGDKMIEGSVADNMITLLITGHETTSGFLSFIAWRLMDNIEVQRKAQQEVDEVIGTGPIKLEHLAKLPYITAVMREAIRLTPTAPGGAIGALPDSTEDPINLAGGKYQLPKGANFRVVMPLVMTDPSIWGEDASDFRPERCLDESFRRLPKNAWKPFGNGQRSCIGRTFAWQESILACAMILQNFDLRFHDPAYKLRIKQTLTIKPADLMMRATLRKGVDIDALERKLTSSEAVYKPLEPQGTINGTRGAEKKPLAVFWAGNAGTRQSLANSVEQTASSHGFVPEIKDLDSAVDSLLRDKPMLIITSSYEGNPPDNAKHFMEYLSGLKDDWQSTYQRIPTLCDELLEKSGATRLTVRGECDVAVNDIFNEYDAWETKSFWPALKQAFGGTDADETEDLGLDAELLPSMRSSHLKQSVREAVVVKNYIIGSVDNAHRQKRHLELELPTDLEYRAGDYLSVLPINHYGTIHRIMVRYGLPWDAMIHIKSKNTILPNDGPVSVHDLLAAYVEINQPATQRNLKKLSAATHNQVDTAALVELAGDAFAEQITAKRVPVLDLLERYPSISITFQEYLSMLPQLRLRQYSISSSSLATPGHCTLTFGVLDDVALSGDGKRFYGVASNYLARLKPGDHVHIQVKQSQALFHLPTNIEETPLIMAAAGTGIAPFRGFVQEGAEQIKAGRKLAPALLFFGCQDPQDVLYVEEFAQWVAAGAVDVRFAFSKQPAESHGTKYVQDRFWQDREEVVDLFRKGAKVFVCGHGRVGDGLKWRAIDIRKQKGVDSGYDFTKEELEKWFGDLRNERYMADLFD